MLIVSRTPISKQTKAAVNEAIDHELWIKHPKRIRKSWSLTIVSWRKKWKSSARSSTYQISPGKKRQKRNRNTVASGKSFSEAVLIGNGNSRLHSIEVSNNSSAINSGVVVWCCFPVEIFVCMNLLGLLFYLSDQQRKTGSREPKGWIRQKD